MIQSFWGLRRRQIPVSGRWGGVRGSLAGLFAVCAVVSLSIIPKAQAVSCISQSQLSDAERDELAGAAREFGTLIAAGNVAAVRRATIPSLAAQFGGISSVISDIAPLLKGASLTAEHLYKLDASDLTAAEDQTQFFCGGQVSGDVVFSIPQIPPGRYAIAVLHATGVAQPQQITLILSRSNDAAGSAGAAAAAASSGAISAASPALSPGSGAWKLAGLYVRPLMAAGHDGVWYWIRARDYAKAKKNWNAYYYYQTAATLLAPVDFVTTPNLDKLIKEQTAAAPEALPGDKAMTLTSNGHSYLITGLHTDGSLGGLDLVIAYQAPDNSDPVATRTRNVELMQAMLSQHPELREAFHGLWVYSNATGQRTFANELPMNQIP